MSILADHEIKKLCDLGPLLTMKEMSDEMQQDEQLLADIKAHVASFPNKNHPSFFVAAEFTSRLRERWWAQKFGMIYPFEPSLIREVLRAREPDNEVIKHKIVSKGLTSYGYDVSLSDKVKLFTNINSATIDPKRFDDEESLVDATVRTDPRDGSRYVILPPNSYLLGVTQEYFRIPRNVMVICLGKSTYARCGAIVNATPIEPGFHGNVVIEISNSTPSPMRIYVNEGIAQFLFFEGNECETSYADRGGKYQGQTGVTLPKV